MVDLQKEFVQRLWWSSDISEHLPTLYALVVACQAKNVIELGVGGGNSTVAFLAALERTGGKLWSVDIEAKIINDMRKLLGDVYWATVVGDDLNSDVISWLPHGVDIVFIDTTHEFEHTWRELGVYSMLVRRGGYILMHDTVTDVGVKRAVADWLETHKDFSYYNFEHCNGLGVMTKE